MEKEFKSAADYCREKRADVDGNIDKAARDFLSVIEQGYVLENGNTGEIGSHMFKSRELSIVKTKLQEVVFWAKDYWRLRKIDIEEMEKRFKEEDEFRAFQLANGKEPLPRM